MKEFWAPLNNMTKSKKINYQENIEKFDLLLKKADRLSSKMHDLYAEYFYLTSQMEKSLKAHQNLFLFKENLGVFKGIENQDE